MRATQPPLVLYVPGLLPKPEPGVHRDALFRCLIAGVERIDPDMAQSMMSEPHGFDVVAWTFDFYREHRDFGLDADDVDAVIAQRQASEQDIEEATSLRRRVMRSLYRVGNLFPYLVPHLADERVQLHLRDLWRYSANRNGIADHIREMLKVALRAASASGRPTLLIGHSMGSVIAYDTLWELTHVSQDELAVDLLLTMGSPLGQRYVRRHVLGCDRPGSERYPANIRRWVNLSAAGDMTAIEPSLSRHFGEMAVLGLVPPIEDTEIFNYYRGDGELNVHAEYGYLVNKVTARVVADWWRSAIATAPVDEPAD